MDHDENPIPRCTCKDCGRTFLKGTQGDNEEFCLRCEAIAANEAEWENEQGGEE